MRKPVLAICEQQRCRSACAFAQSDQHLCCSLLAKSKISRLKLVSVTEQVGLSFTCSKMQKTGLLVTRLNFHKFMPESVSCT